MRPDDITSRPLRRCCVTCPWLQFVCHLFYSRRLNSRFKNDESGFHLCKDDLAIEIMLCNHLKYREHVGPSPCVLNRIVPIRQHEVSNMWMWTSMWRPFHSCYLFHLYCLPLSHPPSSPRFFHSSISTLPHPSLPMNPRLLFPSRVHLVLTPPPSPTPPPPPHPLPSRSAGWEGACPDPDHPHQQDAKLQPPRPRRRHQGAGGRHQELQRRGAGGSGPGRSVHGHEPAHQGCSALLQSSKAWLGCGLGRHRI